MQKHSKKEMCHFLVPVGQPKMMHKNFMHRHLRIFVVRCSRMKFYAGRRGDFSPSRLRRQPPHGGSLKASLLEKDSPGRGRWHESARRGMGGIA